MLNCAIKLEERSSAHEVRIRTDQVLVRLLHGDRRREIIEYARLIGWGVANRTVDYYIHKANEELKDVFDKTARRCELGKSLMRKEMLFRKCIEAENWMGAAQVQRGIDKMLGLDV